MSRKHAFSRPAGDALMATVEELIWLTGIALHRGSRPLQKNELAHLSSWLGRTDVGPARQSEGITSSGNCHSSRSFQLGLYAITHAL
jgi:hypothetical protein